MATLPLAVAIADTISEAARRRACLDVEERASWLLRAHPRAKVTHSDVVETLREVGVSAGVVAKPH
jgi:hypothetical protein